MASWSTAVSGPCTRNPSTQSSPLREGSGLRRAWSLGLGLVGLGVEALGDLRIAGDLG